LNEQPRRRIARGDFAGDGTRHDKQGIDLARRNIAVDLGFRLAEHPHGVPRRLQCSFRALLIGYRLFQVLLGNSLQLIELSRPDQCTRGQVKHARRRDQVRLGLLRTCGPALVERVSHIPACLASVESNQLAGATLPFRKTRTPKEWFRSTSPG
jgi:hypothetical protein